MTMNFVLAFMYGCLGFTYTKNNLQNMKKVAHYLSLIQQNQENIMTESLRLKFFMIRNILLGSATFCFSNVLHFAFANMLGD